MSRHDSTAAVLSALVNPTKLQVLFLLMKHHRLTVTQMSKEIGVSKANLYHFVSQMVKDELLSEPEAEVKGNYVEKYYRLQWNVLASVDPADQRKKVKEMKPEQQREILMAFLASATLVSRMLTDEVSRADKDALKRISQAFQSRLMNMTYMVIPDEVYEGAIKKLNEAVDGIRKSMKGKRLSFGGNRILVLGVPQLQESDA
jgi:DNA-binding transcriptional ArsR family regulator